MQRSTKVHFKKFANSSKQEFISNLIDEFTSIVQVTIDEFWDSADNLKFAPTYFYEKIKQESSLSSALVQIATKQALGIIKGVKKKFNQRAYVLDKLKIAGENTEYLERAIEKNPISKPVVRTQDIIFDSRNSWVDLDNHTSFDGWFSFTATKGRCKVKNENKITIPFKRNKHFNRLEERGSRKTSIALSRDGLKFTYDIEDYTKKSGEIVGVDIGVSSTISISNGFVSSVDNYGHSLSSIMMKMSKQKKGSKAFGRSQTHRKNFINWTINQLDFSKVKELRREDIKDLRKGKRTSRFLSSWVYTKIVDKVDMKCEDQGVLVKQISPTYTSQRCSVCEWTKNGNRDGKKFVCDSCNNEMDADLNAARNIAVVRPILYHDRSKFNIELGFYWKNLEEELIDPLPKAKCQHI